MANFADDSGLIAGLRAASPQRTFQKASVSTEGAGTYQSLWKVAGFPAAGANPPLFSAGAGYVPTKSTLGAFPFTNTTLPAKNALAKYALLSANPGILLLYDRLWACSGLGTVVTTAQTIVTPGSLPAGRDPNNGQDVEPWLEVYTAPGATTATWTLTGVDAAGNTGRTWVYTHPANAETLGQTMPLMPGGATPATTSTIRQVISFICSATSGTAGDVGLTLRRRLGMAGNALAIARDVQDAFLTGLPDVFDNACLEQILFCSTTTSGLLMGELVVANN
jgi:hypothetical protein